MRRTSSPPSILVKLGSHAVALAVIASAAGCVVDAATPAETDAPPANGPVAAESKIDTNATLEATAAGGVGVFVEYASGGEWTIFTACDTATSDVACSFDIRVQPASGTISTYSGQNLGPNDSLNLNGDGSIELSTVTSTGLDGVVFNTLPGAGISLYMTLDDEEQPRFVYWVSSGVLHEGAPSDPMGFSPSSP